MNALVIFGLLAVLMLTGMPISISLGLTVLTFLFTMTQVPLESVALKPDCTLATVPCPTSSVLTCAIQCTPDAQSMHAGAGPASVGHTCCPAPDRGLQSRGALAFAASSGVKALPTIGRDHFAIEQCPPLLAWPEPAAIRGGSLRRSTGSEA